MYCTRPVSRSPGVVRIISNAPRRSASFFPGFVSHGPVAPFFGRTASQDPFRSLDRILEEFTSPNFPFARQQTSSQSFQPRFDVRENESSYELRGEIPGVEGKDLEVEFTDAQTLTIRGRSVRESSSDSQPEVIQSAKGKEIASEATQSSGAADAAASEAEAEAENSDAASTYSTGSYQKPSVEDADVSESKTNAKETQVAAPAESATAQDVATISQPQEQPKEQARYWLSERSIGSFQRTFGFPQRVDQAAVTASLKNGILSIVVPKAAKPEPRKINIE